MDFKSYNELLRMVEPLIGKQITNMCELISPTERLSITVRKLATGATFEDPKLISAFTPLTRCRCAGLSGRASSGHVVSSCLELHISLRAKNRSP
ncbi:hypothetical protein RRG08_033915 [Elysia crispata]|uniref:Uncharacterized protein n=1 Tax=Elysia crispata TaxID=231223 RepID=A0AAE1BA39_9GAST|nr:hypothetical protein RRG08_033915 [Elysia crispata]